MGWGGPVLCVQKDPETILNGLDQALGFLETDSRLSTIWVLSIQEEHLSSLCADYFVLSRREAPIRIEKMDPLQGKTALAAETSDSLWLDWVCTEGTGSFSLSSYHKAIK